MKDIYRTILSFMLILAGCTPEYYECEIGEADKADLPQSVSVIDVPYSYFLVQTKFQPGIVGQDFRYRATIDGTEYSAAENPKYPSTWTDGQQAFQVVVPENDSHLQRTVRIETSVKDLFGKKEWGEWKTVYEGAQAALPLIRGLAKVSIRWKPSPCRFALWYSGSAQYVVVKVS